MGVMTTAPHRLTPEQSAVLTRRITLASVAVALVLVVLKTGVWLVSGSVALLASAADSGLDLLASLVTVFAVRYAIAPPDAEHRFGHGKAEAFASLVQAGLVFASAALIGQEAIRSLFDPKPVENEAWAVAVMAISTLLTGALIFGQSLVLRRTNSVAVAGDRAHYASDLASNMIALVSIGAAAVFGVAGFDAIGGLAVAAILLWSAVGVFRQASDQLLDHELPDEERERIVELARQDPAIQGVHSLRTRASGPYIHIQMHVELDPDLTLEAAHRQIIACEGRVLAEFPAADILIHADPKGRAAPHEGAFAQASRV
jgi:cation diffusion facilitator family transporter